MAKNKKSKILAMALCASVMTGIYASPVMAAYTGLVVSTTGGNKIYDHKSEIITIKGVTFKAGGVLTAGAGTFNTLSVAGNRFAVGPKGGIKAADGRFRVDANGNIIVKGALGGSEMFRVDAVTGNVTAAGALNAATLTTTGDATVGGKLVVNGETTLTGKLSGQEATFTTVNANNFNGVTLANEADGVKVGGINVTAMDDRTAGLERKVHGAYESTYLEGAVRVNNNLGLQVLDNTNNVVASISRDGAVNAATLTTTGDATVGGNAEVKGTLSAADGKFFVGEFGGINAANGNFKVNKDGDVEAKGTLSVADGKFVVGEFGGINAANGNFKVNKDGDVEAKGTLSAAGGKFVVGEFGGINAANGNFKVNKDGVVNADSLKLATAGDIEIGAAVKSLIDAGLPDKVEGITRPEEGKTVVEGGAEFTENGMTMGNTVVEDGKITVGTAADNQTIIEGGAITAKSLVLGTKDVGATIAGIKRETVTDEFDNEVSTTTIEGALKVSDNGLISNAAGSFTVDSNGGLAAGGGTFAADMTGIKMRVPVQMFLQGDNNYKGNSVIDLGTTISDIDDRLVVLEDKTQNIKPGTGAGTGTGEGGTAAGESNNIIEVPATEDGHTGINGDVTVGGEINAGEIVVGDKTGGNQTTITDDSITTDKGDFGSEVTVGDKTTITSGNITVGAAGDQTTINGGTINTGDINAATGDFSESVTVGVEGNQTTINGGTINTDNIIADKGNIGKVDMTDGVITVNGGTTIDKNSINTEDGQFDNSVTVGNVEGNQTTINGGNVAVDKEVTVGANTTITDGNINLGGEDGTNINADGMIVGNANGVNTNVSAGDVVITDKDGKDIALSDVGYVENIDRELQANGNYDGTVVGGINAEADIRRAEVNRLDNRISKVEDRIDKVGAMSAAIANLRTMGYDPAAPTEIAVGVGQYRSETGVALGMFHYPNKDFMLSLSVSTSGDEVMGGIGATWKFGRKSAEEVEAAEAKKAEKARIKKAEKMRKAAKEAKVKAQQERHAKMAAEMKK